MTNQQVLNLAKMLLEVAHDDIVAGSPARLQLARAIDAVEAAELQLIDTPA